MNKKLLVIFIVGNMFLFFCEYFYFYNDFEKQEEKSLNSTLSEEITVLPEITVIGKKIN